MHPTEEANGLRALFNLEEPKYSIEQIVFDTGKSSVFVAHRLRLTGLIPASVEAFYRQEIPVRHAQLLAKLQPIQQEQAFTNCFREECAKPLARESASCYLCGISSTE